MVTHHWRTASGEFMAADFDEKERVWHAYSVDGPARSQSFPTIEEARECME